MSYNISFVRPKPGRTLFQTLGAAYKSGPERMRLTPEQRAVWDRIVERVTRDLGPASCEDFGSALSLRREGPQGAVRLVYSGTEADIGIPYRYPGDLALPAITQAYHIATIVEEETGLAGYDLQAFQPIAGGDLGLAAAKLGEMTLLTRESLARRGLSPEDVW